MNTISGVLKMLNMKVGVDTGVAAEPHHVAAPAQQHRGLQYILSPMNTISEVP
jgi:hypothetical protein